MKCKSPICIQRPDQTRGREFEPPKDAQGIAKIWCPQCIELTKHLQFYARQTAEMIRAKWQAYAETELPHEVQLFMDAFVRELLLEFGEEL